MRTLFLTVFLMFGFFPVAQASSFCTVTLQEEDPGVSNLFRHQTHVEMLDCTDEEPQQLQQKMRISDTRVFKSISIVSKLMDSEGWNLTAMTTSIHNRFVLVFQK